MEKTLITFYWIIFSIVSLFIGELFMLRKLRISTSKIIRQSVRHPRPESYVVFKMIVLGFLHCFVILVNVFAFSQLFKIIL